MAGEAHALVDAIRTALREHANRDRAIGQQAYMKSAMPFHGLTTPELRATLRPLLKMYPLPDRTAWDTAIRTLWDEATHREEWYAAIGVARHRRYRDWRVSTDSLPLYQHMIRTGAWWDVCDEIAQRLVGEVLAANREAVTPVMRQWAHDDDLWIRRVSILCQLKMKDATDRSLLADCIESSLDDRDFFARKGIGWALREFSRTDPAWVRAFVAQHDARLSGLSRREALRLLPKEP